MKYILIFTFLVSTVLGFGQKRNELAPTPPMGWNSWNWFGKPEINEKNMKDCMDAIVKEGLLEAGYNYFVIDGGWRDTKLGSNGELLAHPVKFPNGIKPLADYAHSLGLKFGLHTVPGTHDCGGDPVGGFGHEEVQIKQFVEWGLDFVKVDLCKQTEDPCSTCQKSKTGWSEENIKNTYSKWSKLLNSSGRDILFSISAYRSRVWYPEYCNMARSTQDILSRISHGAVFNSEARENIGLLTVMAIAEFNNLSAKAAGNGFWNDPDMLATGEQGLNFEEQKSHFALWCVMSSPLILGNDPRKMTAEEKSIILNKTAIAINQDPTEQGKRIKKEGDIEIWQKHMKNGQNALLILNSNSQEIKDYNLNLSEFGIKIKKKRNITEVYSGIKFESGKGILSLNIKPHACIFLKIE